MTKKEIDADKLWEVAWTYVKTVVDTLREPFLILDERLNVIEANKVFYRVFRTTVKQTEGKRVYDLGNGQWDIPKLRILLEDILPENTYFKGYKVVHDFPNIGRKIMILNARRIYMVGGKKPMVLLAIEDITKQEQLEKQQRGHVKELSILVVTRTKALESRIKELERLNKIMVGRELKMIELKDEIDKLKKAKRQR